MLGTVYVLSNPAMPGLIKIGKTAGPVEKRVNELSSSTGVPMAFVIERAFIVKDMDFVERWMHRLYKKYRVNDRREFFRMDTKNVLEILAGQTKGIDQTQPEYTPEPRLEIVEPETVEVVQKPVPMSKPEPEIKVKAKRNLSRKALCARVALGLPLASKPKSKRAIAKAKNARDLKKEKRFGSIGYAMIR